MIEPIKFTKQDINKMIDNAIELRTKEIKEGLEKIMIDKDNPNEPVRAITVEEWEEFWKEFLKEK